mgnify:CR=1 FL=1
MLPTAPAPLIEPSIRTSVPRPSGPGTAKSGIIFEPYPAARSLSASRSRSNSSIRNGGVGYACVAEVRMYETIESGKPRTPYLQFGDTVRIEMFDAADRSVFGAIEQRVERHSA